MKKILLLPALLLYLAVPAQIVVDMNDMPVPGDTVRLSTANLQNFDENLTGTSWTWDFSDLNFMTQRVDTFVSVTSTPLVYNIAFNSVLDPEHKATVASPQADFSAPGGTVNFTDVYFYYQNSDSTYKQVGQAANVNGAPIPIKYNEPERLFNFPLTLNDTDSSYTEYGVSIPTLGYYGQKRKRINTVDGWGMLITPYGTFSVWRVKSTLALRDTIYYDAMGMGFGFNRNETEIKWMGDNFGQPLLQVNITQQATRAVYIDSVRTDNSGVSENAHSASFSISPNPCTDQIIVQTENKGDHKEMLVITDLSGKILYETGLTRPSACIPINLPGGAYIVNVSGHGSRLLIRQ